MQLLNKTDNNVKHVIYLSGGCLQSSEGLLISDAGRLFQPVKPATKIWLRALLREFYSCALWFYYKLLSTSRVVSLR